MLSPYDAKYQHLFNGKKKLSVLEINLRQSSTIRTEVLCFTVTVKVLTTVFLQGPQANSSRSNHRGCTMGWHSGMIKDMASHPNDPHQQLSALHCQRGNPHRRLPSFTTMLTEIKIAKQLQQIQRAKRYKTRGDKSFVETLLSLLSLCVCFFFWKIKPSFACDPRVAVCQAGPTPDQCLMTLKP